MIRCSRLPNVGCSEFGILLSNLGFSYPSGALLLGACRQQPLPVLPPLACATGCALHVGGSPVAIPYQAGRFGLALLPLPVPNDPNLFHIRLCAQAARFDPGCVSLTDGVEIRIGRGGCR